MDQTVELFSGRDSAFSHVAMALGFETFTVDIDPGVSPSLVGDILVLRGELLPQNPLVVWAAPPGAEAFKRPESWESDGSWAPRDAAAERAVATFRAAVGLITQIKPTWWFIENPRSFLRDMPLVAGFNRGYPSRTRRTIRHDQFGGNGPGETDVWTNAYWWIPRPTESESNPDVLPSRRVPPYVFAEVFQQLEDMRAGGPIRV